MEACIHSTVRLSSSFNWRWRQKRQIRTNCFPQILNWWKIRRPCRRSNWLNILQDLSANECTSGGALFCWKRLFYNRWLQGSTTGYNTLSTYRRDICVSLMCARINLLSYFMAPQNLPPHWQAIQCLSITFQIALSPLYLQILTRRLSSEKQKLLKSPF